MKRQPEKIESGHFQPSSGRDALALPVAKKNLIFKTVITAFMAFIRNVLLLFYYQNKCRIIILHCGRDGDLPGP